MKRLILSLLILANLAQCQPVPQSERYNLQRLQLKATEARKFCKLKGFNTDYCILIDMSIHSGLNRLFVWDFAKQSIVDSGLCSHGCCDSAWGADQTKENPRFSNVSGSHCASLGKYKIGARAYSQWGINVHYKMHGLDSTNSKAYARDIVLHSWKDVPEKEVYPTGAPEGWGCPALSNKVMTRLDKRLNKSSKPVLLWIFE